MLEKIIFLVLFTAGWVAFVWAILDKWRRVRKGRPENRTDRPWSRLAGAVFRPLVQSCSIGKRRWFTGFMHAFIAWAFFVFVAAVGFGVSRGLGGPGLVDLAGVKYLATAMDITALAALVGVVVLALRRYALRPKALGSGNNRGDILVHPKARYMPPVESAVVFALIFLHMLSYFLETGAALAAEPARFSGVFVPFSSFVARAIPGAGAAGLEKIGWWVGMLVFIGFLFYMPHCKHLHLFFGPVNLFFRKLGSPGRMRALNLEDEDADHFGALQVGHLPWKNLLDGFACIECGRCQEQCPAWRTDKPLSPKSVVENTRFLLGEKNPHNRPIAETLVSPEGVFACTTCAACTVVCPMGNEPMMAVLEARQGLALDLGQYPQEFNALYRGLEVHGNPWGLEASQRDEWFGDLDVPRIDARPEAEFLLWEGCVGALDPRGQKIARALVKVLKAGGVDFAVSGSVFKCNGDVARRTGNEYLFQALAAENLETFKALGIKKIITLCPHCYHSLKNEYPELGADFAVVDHTVFILKLLQEGRLKLKPGQNLALTYHDPCYLGRHNNIYQEPREILGEIGKIKEMKDNRSLSLCCGGGGGGFWTEEKTEAKIYRLRTQQALATGASVVATACPFCTTMIEDGLKDANQESVEVKDIAELVADRVLSL